MLVELWERFGQPLSWWVAQPLALLRLVYGHMQEIDRRRDWIDRARAIDRAWLMAMAFHDSEKLKDAQLAHIASASSEHENELLLVRGAAMAAEIERGGVFLD